MEILLPVSMVILHWVPPIAPSTTRPSQELKEDPVLYTLVTFVGTGGACVPLLPLMRMMEVMEWLQDWLPELLVLNHLAYNLAECGLTDDTSNKQCSVSCQWLQVVCFEG